MKVIKVEISGHEEYYFQPINEIAGSAEAELDGAEVGDFVKLTLCEMSEDEYNALPEFMGW